MALVGCGYGFPALKSIHCFGLVLGGWGKTGLMLLPTKHAVMSLEEIVTHANQSQI